MLILIVGTGAYYLGTQKNKTTDNPVVQQNAPSPTSYKSDSKNATAPSPSVDETANWKTYSNPNISFTFKYPAVISLKEENMIVLTQIGTNQKDATELSDGIGLQFSLPHILEEFTLQQYVQQEMEKSKENADIIKPIQTTSVGNYTGYTFTTRGLSINQYIYLKHPNIKDEFVYIVNYTSDPNNKGYQNTVNTILSTFKFTN